ncbi:hypothetical protein TNCV_3627311 [Trichonephila clavipes]|nr:hypothetical protein TNCV_3627311 [Trichonephila clavipes]
MLCRKRQEETGFDKNNDFELEDKERSGSSKKFEDNELEELHDQGPCLTLAELGKSLQVDGSTVLKRFASVRNDPKARTLGSVVSVEAERR